MTGLGYVNITEFSSLTHHTHRISSVGPGLYNSRTYFYTTIYTTRAYLYYCEYNAELLAENDNIQMYKNGSGEGRDCSFSRRSRTCIRLTSVRMQI